MNRQRYSWISSTLLRNATGGWSIYPWAVSVKLWNSPRPPYFVSAIPIQSTYRYLSIYISVASDESSYMTVRILLDLLSKIKC